MYVIVTMEFQSQVYFTIGHGVGLQRFEICTVVCGAYLDFYVTDSDQVNAKLYGKIPRIVKLQILNSL